MRIKRKEIVARLNFQITEELKNTIVKVCEAEGISQAEWIREAIVEKLEREHHLDN